MVKAGEDWVVPSPDDLKKTQKITHVFCQDCHDLEKKISDRDEEANKR